MKLYVVGHKDTVLGFSLIGVEGFATENAEEAIRKIEELLGMGDIGIIMITAGIARRLEPRIREIEMDVTLPIILRIPAPEEPLNRPPVQQLVRETLGVRM